MAKQDITAQLMEDLFIDAMGGDSYAYDQYFEYARKLAKQVNQQMLQQERRGVTAEAYRRAQSFLGDRQRFKENVKSYSTIEDLQTQVDEMLSFRSARDYSVPYATKAKAQIEKITEALKAAGVDTEDERVTFWMNELFKTDAWKEYKKAHGSGTNLIQAAQDEFKKGKTVDDLLTAYEAYKEGKSDSPDLIESWERFAKW